MQSEPRFYIDKPSGSGRATVRDRDTGLVMQRFNIFKNYGGLDGWAAADRYCKRLNDRAAASLATPRSQT